MNTIDYKGIQYPIVELPNGDNVSTETFENVLLGEDGLPVDKEAEGIDNEIYFYVPDDMIGKPIAEIEQYIAENT